MRNDLHDAVSVVITLPGTDFDVVATPGTTLMWKFLPEDWTDRTTLGDILYNYVREQQLPLALRLIGRRDAKEVQLRSLPWRALCDHVVRHGSGDLAPALTTAAELRDYLQEWLATSPFLDPILQWKYSVAAMCEICRLGAWLGDTVNTELCVCLLYTSDAADE